MAIDSTKPRTRRALLVGATGAAAATTLAAIARPLPALAAGDDDQTIKVGHAYVDARTTTRLENRTGIAPVLSVGGTGGRALDAWSDSEAAILGVSNSNNGIRANSQTGDALYAYSGSGSGVFATSQATNQPVIVGVSSGNSTGVQGFSGPNPPLHGPTAPPPPAKTGVYGSADQDATSVGVSGRSANGTGVLGKTSTGVAVSGTGGSGRGGVFSGKTAQLRLSPASAATHPESGSAGDLFVDTSKRLWFCKGDEAWVQLA